MSAVISIFINCPTPEPHPSQNDWEIPQIVSDPPASPPVEAVRSFSHGSEAEEAGYMDLILSIDPRVALCAEGFSH